MHNVAEGVRDGKAVRNAHQRGAVHKDCAIVRPVPCERMRANQIKNRVVVPVYLTDARMIASVADPIDRIEYNVAIVADIGRPSFVQVN